MGNHFENLVNNFERSMRGIAVINNEEVKMFPHVAGSVFISKLVALLKTVVNEKSIYASLSREDVNERIYRNGKALVVQAVLDETVEVENMLFIFESFQNVIIDIYKGMKLDGKYGKLQKELNDFDNIEEPEEKEIVV